MNLLEFYEKLKNIIESDYFQKRLLQKSTSDRSRKNFIISCLNFLITTRDFEKFNYFIDNYFLGYFPTEYLLREKGLSVSEYEQLIFENYIKNGFLFHATPSFNVDSILERGLLTLNDRYNCDVYQKCIELDQVYRSIKEKNQSANEKILSLRTLINVPGRDGFMRERFDTVYLSHNLLDVLSTYGTMGEFSELFLCDLFFAIKGCHKEIKTSKQKLREELLSVILDKSIKISDAELKIVLNFFDMFYEEKYSEEKEKAILLIPNLNISTLNYEKTDNGFETILNNKAGEIEHVGSIGPSNIIAIYPDQKMQLKVKMKQI